MNATVVRLQTSEHDYSERSDIDIRWLPSRRRSTIALQHATLLSSMGANSSAAEDLLAIAVAAYCADRSVVRSEQSDAWTRHIEIDVPVADPDRWNEETVGELLCFLTGDDWIIRLRRGQPNPGFRTTQDQLLSADSVSLFSGGVDSLTGAYESLESTRSIALVSYFGDSTTGQLQQHLAECLGSPVNRYGFRLEVERSNAAERWPGFIDSTMRSRSLLFAALGLLVARTLSADELQMAENGYIALNVPLHAGRVGSLSTRTAHPQFIDGLNQLIEDAQLGARVVNPFFLLTKGEVTERLVERVPEIASKTISCAHPSVGRWVGQEFGSCGYCYPCIIRQAGFHHAGGDSTAYALDPFTDPSFFFEGKRSADIRSVARFLLEATSLGDVISTGRLGDFATAQRLYAMHLRGVEELRKLFEHRATAEVKKTLGL